MCCCLRLGSQAYISIRTVEVSVSRHGVDTPKHGNPAAAPQFLQHHTRHWEKKNPREPPLHHWQLTSYHVPTLFSRFKHGYSTIVSPSETEPTNHSPPHTPSPLFHKLHSVSQHWCIQKQILHSRPQVAEQGWICFFPRAGKKERKEKTLERSSSPSSRLYTTHFSTLCKGRYNNAAQTNKNNTAKSTTRTHHGMKNRRGGGGKGGRGGATTPLSLRKTPLPRDFPRHKRPSKKSKRYFSASQ